jgi:ATP-dependent Lon protease
MSIFKKSGEKKAEEKLQAKTIEELRRTIATANMPLLIQHIANNELDMLSKISPATAEYTIGLTYIDYLVNIPWNKKTEDNLDLKRAERILNERHHGLQKVKERVLEHLAVKILLTNKKSRILVVDDEEIARKNLEHILKKENYTVIAAASGAEAIEKMEASEFDVVLTDIRMEKVNGIQVLEKAKRCGLVLNRPSKKSCQRYLQRDRFSVLQVHREQERPHWANLSQMPSAENLREFRWAE